MAAPGGEYRETLGRPGDSATVYLAGTTTLATLYTDVNETTAAPNPTVLDSFGALLFFADVGAYDVLVNGALIRAEVTAHVGTYALVGDKGRTQLGLGAGAAKLVQPKWEWFDYFERSDRALIRDVAPSGHRYFDGAGMNAPSIVGGRYTVSGATPHISAFAPVILSSVPAAIFGECCFDTSYGTGGEQRMVLVSCREAKTVVITGVTTANPGVVTTESPHGFVTGQVITISSVVGATQANGVQTITVLSPTTFSVPVNVTGAYTSGGTATSSLANQSMQAFITPTDYGVFWYGNAAQNTILSGTFPVPLLQDGTTRYPMTMWADLPSGTLTVNLPQLGFVSVVDSHVSPLYWDVQAQIQIDIPSAPSPSGNVLVTAGAAG